MDLSFAGEDLFSRGHATLHLAVSVGRSVGRSVRHIFEFRAVFALLLLPNRPRLDCRVSGLVYAIIAKPDSWAKMVSQAFSTHAHGRRDHPTDRPTNG